MKPFICKWVALSLMVIFIGGCSGSSEEADSVDLKQLVISKEEEKSTQENKKIQEEEETQKEEQVQKEQIKKNDEKNQEEITKEQKEIQENQKETSIENQNYTAEAVTGKENKTSVSDSNKTVLEAYQLALENIYHNQIFPGGEDYSSQLGEGDDITSNQFAVYDIDSDGEEELILLYTTAYTAGMLGIIYGFDSDTGNIFEELLEFPALTYYDNGVIEAQASHNHGMASDLNEEFWPYTLYCYQQESDTYQVVGNIDAWSKNFAEIDYNGNAFPKDIDKDGDGIVYIQTDGSYTQTVFMDREEYQNWRDSYLKDAKEVTLPFMNLTIENITQICP